jgi:ribosome-associated protein
MTENIKLDSEQLARAVAELADARKADRIVVLDVRAISSITDFFVIASGNSDPHLKAIADEVSVGMKKEHGVTAFSDGGAGSAWVALDYFDVIVHIMREDIRDKYKLESLWGDAPRLDLKLGSASTSKAPVSAS